MNYGSQPELPNVPRSQLEHLSHQGSSNKLPAIGDAQRDQYIGDGLSRANRPLNNAASNAEIYSYKRLGQNQEQMQDH